MVQLRRFLQGTEQFRFTPPAARQRRLFLHVAFTSQFHRHLAAQKHVAGLDKCDVAASYLNALKFMMLGVNSEYLRRLNFAL